MLFLLQYFKSTSTLVSSLLELLEMLRCFFQERGCQKVCFLSEKAFTYQAVMN